MPPLNKGYLTWELKVALIHRDDWFTYYIEKQTFPAFFDKLEIQNPDIVCLWCFIEVCQDQIHFYKHIIFFPFYAEKTDWKA